MKKREERYIVGDEGWLGRDQSGSAMLMHARDLEPAAVEGDRFDVGNAEGSHADLEDEPGDPRDIVADAIRREPREPKRKKK